MGIENFFNYFKKINEQLSPDKKFMFIGGTYADVTDLHIDFANFINDILDENSVLLDVNINIEDDEELTNYIHLIGPKIVDKINQIKSLYPNAFNVNIYFESLATCAKIPEQYRRGLFRKIQGSVKGDLERRLKVTPVNKFNRGLFSVQNNFLTALSTYLEDNGYLVNRYKPGEDDPEMRNLIGEAENKIMSAIKGDFDSEKTDQNYVIYSKDADVILISAILTHILSNREKNLRVYVTRSTEIPGEFFHIDTIKFIEYLLGIFDIYRKYIFNERKQTNRRYNQPIKEINYIVTDLLYLFMFIGNDIIPGIDKINMYSLNILIYSYAELDDYLLNFNKKFLLKKDILITFFNKLHKNTDNDENTRKINRIRTGLYYNRQPVNEDEKVYTGLVLEKFNDQSMSILGDDSQDECITSNVGQKHFEYQIYDWDIYKENTNLNTIVLDLINKGFEKGYYFYEKNNFYNVNNFFVDDSTNLKLNDITNTDVLKTDIISVKGERFPIYKTRSFLLYPDYNDPVNKYIIRLNDKQFCYTLIMKATNIENFYEEVGDEYNVISLLSQASVQSPLVSSSSLESAKGGNINYKKQVGGNDVNSQSKNYIEGLTLLLDLYFNNFGFLENNFWMYLYLKPKASELENYVSSIHYLPNYVNLSYTNYYRKCNYFNLEQFNSYKNNFIINRTFNKLIYNVNQIINRAVTDRQTNNIIYLSSSVQVTRLGYNNLLFFRKKVDDKLISIFDILFNCIGSENRLNLCFINENLLVEPIYYMETVRDGDHQFITYTNLETPNNFRLGTRYNFNLLNNGENITQFNYEPVHAIGEIQLDQASLRNLLTILINQKLEQINSIPDETFMKPGITLPTQPTQPRKQEPDSPSDRAIEYTIKRENIIVKSNGEHSFRTGDKYKIDPDSESGEKTIWKLNLDGVYEKIDKNGAIKLGMITFIESQVLPQASAVAQGVGLSVPRQDLDWRRSGPPQVSLQVSTRSEEDQGEWVSVDKKKPMVRPVVQAVQAVQPVQAVQAVQPLNGTLYKINKREEIYNGMNYIVSKGQLYLVENTDIGEKLWLYKKDVRNFSNIRVSNPGLLEFVKSRVNLNKGKLNQYTPQKLYNLADERVGGGMEDEENDIYKQKYLKYKEKYLQLKKQLGL